MAEINKDELKRLLYKEAQGTLTIPEQQKLDDWYNAFDVDQKDLTIFRNEDHERTVKARLLNRIMESDAPANPSQLTAFRNKRLRRWASVAALFVGIIGAGLFYRYSSNASFFANSNEATMLSYQSGQGKTKKVVLEDGTEIWLNAGSKLSYPAHFEKQSRAVSLEGEAFFQVSHDSSRPFTVRMGNLSAKVLGTSFNIAAYPTGDKIRISVATGRVGVQDGQKGLDTLTHDKRIVFEKATGKFKVDDYPASFVNAWREGTIRLEGASFSELAAIIKNNFGYELKTGNRSLHEISFNTTFQKHDKIENVMDVISRIPDAQYRIRDHIIEMY